MITKIFWLPSYVLDLLCAVLPGLFLFAWIKVGLVREDQKIECLVSVMTYAYRFKAVQKKYGYWT